MNAFDGKFWIASLSKYFVHWFLTTWNLKERKRYELFQAALYEISNSIMYDSLIIDTNVYPFLRYAKAKSYKLVKTPDSYTKLIAYFKS
jgi:hypothetical protein